MSSFAGSKASGKYSHAEGYGVCATGLASHAEGYYTIASETGSHAGGYYTKAKSSYQTTVGKYNDNKNNTLFEVGNGTADNARSNAFEVYSDGRAIVGADPTTAMGVATKQYVDNAISLPQVTDSYSASTTDSYSCNYVNEINDKFNYTQEEQRIGTWIDGKPIYRQVINTTGDSSQGQTIATISNIDNIVNMFGWVKNGNMHRSCSTAFFGSTAWASQLYRDSQYIIVECGSNFASFKNGATITLICEYTKTTD